MDGIGFTILEWIFGAMTLVLTGAVGYLFKTRESREKQEKEERKEDREQKKDVYEKTLEVLQEEVNRLRAHIVSNDAKHEAQIVHMQKEQDKLREQVSLLKTNILTMSMFGTDGPTAMWAKDLSGRRTWHNEEYERLTGYTLSECMLKTDLEITGDPELAKAWAQNDDEVIRKGIYVLTVEPCSHKDRPTDIFYILVIKWPRKIGGQIVGTDGTAHRMDEILTAIKNSKGVGSV
jgi:PAS domain-containing protein